MTRIGLIAASLLLAVAAAASFPVRAATFPIDYSDPSSDVVVLNSTTGLCEIDPGGNCIMSPDPHDVNIQWLRGREAGAGNSQYNLTIQVQGEILSVANTSYVVNLYTNATNETHWIVNYTNGNLDLYSNETGAPRVDITGNATVWGLNPTMPNSVSMVVDKALLGGPSNISASVNIDATAVMRGDPALGQPYSFQDFGWQVPGRPGTSPTVLNGHVYVKGTTTPIAGATLSVSGGQSVQTNATGYYSIALSPGTFDATATAEGFASVTFSVTLAAGETVTRDVELERTAATLVGDYLVPIAIVGALLAAGLVVFLWSRRRKAGDRPKGGEGP